jgi:hypothetical protein
MTDLTINYFLHTEDENAVAVLLSIERFAGVEEKKTYSSYIESGFKGLVIKLFEDL